MCNFKKLSDWLFNEIDYVNISIRMTVSKMAITLKDYTVKIILPRLKLCYACFQHSDWLLTKFFNQS